LTNGASVLIYTDGSSSVDNFRIATCEKEILIE